MVEALRSTPLGLTALLPSPLPSHVSHEDTSRPAVVFSDGHPWHAGHGRRPAPTLNRLPFSAIDAADSFKVCYLRWVVVTV